MNGIHYLYFLLHILNDLKAKATGPLRVCLGYSDALYWHSIVALCTSSLCCPFPCRLHVGLCNASQAQLFFTSLPLRKVRARFATCSTQHHTRPWCPRYPHSPARRTGQTTIPTTRSLCPAAATRTGDHRAAGRRAVVRVIRGMQCVG